MRRRDFIKAIVGSAAARPLAARAQQPDRIVRIGFLTPQSPNPPWIEASRAWMREHGYLEGRNLVIALRSAEGQKERYTSLIGELLAFKPDVLDDLEHTHKCGLEEGDRHYSDRIDLRRSCWTGACREPRASTRESHGVCNPVDRRRSQATADPERHDPWPCASRRADQLDQRGQ